MRLIRIKRIMCCVIACEVCLFVSGCGIVEQKILYAPKPFAGSTHLSFEQMSGVHIEDASFQSADGTQLHGWFVAPVGSVPRQVVLFSHGRAGNITSFDAELTEFVRRHQVAVLAYDYRGYGKSGGRPSESGLYQDAHAARQWLTSRTGQPAEEIVLMGRSLGAAVAIELASKSDAKALIVECGFTSFPNVVQHHTRNVLTGKRFKSKYHSVEKIAHFSGPVFVSHGRNDKLIPFEHGVQLASAAIGAERVDFVEVEGDHDMPANDSYVKQLDDFFESLIR